MSRETDSFQDNIRKTFIRFSLVPVAAIVTVALFLFGFSWSMFMVHFNKLENSTISQDVVRTINICNEMLSDVSGSLTANELQVDKNEIFSILYKRTADFGEMGNLMILSADRRVLFSNKGTAPKTLTESEYSDWGIWHQIKANKNTPSTIVYNKNLYVAMGLYEGSELRAAIVYAVPGEAITGNISVQNRFVFITDTNGWVYASNTRRLQDDYGQIDDSFYAGSGFIRYEKGLYYSCKSDTGKGLVVTTINDIGKSVTLIEILIVVIIVIFAAIALITIRSTEISSKRYTRDIKKIEDAFEEVQNGNLDVELNTNSSTEFKIIAEDFNQMLNGLKDQIEQNKELAEHAAFSQVKQLESQFNPHFLFNTLDNIRFMAKIDAAAADKMIVSLSRLLRYSIREMREEVTVKEDLDNLQYYLNILQIRFNKRFAYEMNVAEDIYDFLIPKLLLQPLLENAVKYGFNGQEKLTVRIRGYQIQEKLIFVCEDDGAGIEENQLKEIQNNLRQDSNNSAHYGIYNIHRRINLMYSEDYGLDISSSLGEGTTVRLTLPKKLSKPAQNGE